MKENLFNKKKALSPVISTVLLIMIVIIIALIVLIWAMGFVKEAISKTVHGVEKRINEYCLEVKLKPILNNDADKSFGFENIGNVPIFEFSVKLTKSDKGKSKVIKVSNKQKGSVNPGSSVLVENLKHSDYEKIKIIPTLIGKNKEGNFEPFECPERNGIDIK